MPHTQAVNNYVSGSCFKMLANYTIDSNSCPFNPAEITHGKIVYVKIDALNYFFDTIFPRIQQPFILITHNGDDSAPGAYARYLDDPKIIRWFGQNSNIEYHPKFQPIPIGIANPQYISGNTGIFDRVLQTSQHKTYEQKINKLYSNFYTSNNAAIREPLLKFLNGKDFVYQSHQKPFEDYLYDLSNYRFILSPHGNGLDCHRTWEALLVGSIPVVKTSTLDALYQNLPVIIVQDWQEITPAFLEQKYQEIQHTTYNTAKLYMNYWIDLIKFYQSEYTSIVAMPGYSGGRFGDNLVAVAHTLYYALTHKTDFSFTPFKYSDQLELTTFAQTPVRDIQQIITIPYFPVAGTFGCTSNEYSPFFVDWQNQDFKDLLREVIKPTKQLNFITPPDHKISVAVHVRTGRGYDNWTDEEIKRNQAVLYKAPLEQYYLDQINTVSKLLENQPLYVYLFTDDPHPAELAQRYATAINNPLIEFDYRKNNNHHDANVLEDFFSLMNFNILIRSESSYSLMAHKMGDHDMVIFPGEFLPHSRVQKGLIDHKKDSTLFQQSMKKMYQSL